MDGVIAFVTLFAGNFAPRNWAFCSGQILSIATNTALFSLLGTNFGGNGQTTFALPDLRGRVALGTGQGPGLSNISLGEVAGSENITLTTNQIPAHSHPLNLTIKPKAAGAPNSASPANAVYATGNDALFNYSPSVLLHNFPATVTTGNAGSGFPIPLNHPRLALNYIICLFGVFPSRN
jgi:microcystin-dependent protein